MADAPKLLDTDTLRSAYPKINQAIDNSNEAKKVQDDVQAQINTLVVNGDSSPEAAQARVDSTGKTYATLRDRLNTTDAQLAQTATDLNNRGINVKTPFGTGLTKAKGDGVSDDTTAFLDIISYCRTNKIDTLVIPSGTFVIKQTIRVDFPLTIVGFGFRSSTLKISSNVDGIVLVSPYARVKDLEMKADSDTYTSNLITITHPVGAHTWDQYIANVYFHGGNTLPSGTAILVLANDKGIMGTIIEKVHFFKVKDGIRFSITNDNLGFINGGKVKDTWCDYTKYTFNFEGNNISRWVFDNCKGQFNAGWTDYHFYNIRGTGNKILSSLQWDGGKYLIHQKSSNLYIDALTVAGVINNFTDYGFRTFIEAIPVSVGSNNGQGWMNIVDDFIGFNMRNEWKQTVVGTGSIKQTLNTQNPYTQGALLGTGATSGSSAKIDYGQNYVLNRYTQSLVSSYFKINSANTTNIVAKLGMTVSSGAEEAIVLIDPAYPNFMMKVNANLYDTGVPKDLAYHSFQVTRIAQNTMQLFFDRQPIATVTTGILQYDAEPIFEVKNNTSATDEKLFVTNFYCRVGYRLLN